MSVLPVPDFLIDLSRAGASGVPASADPWFHRQLEVCQAWGYNLAVTDGRVRLLFDDDQLIPLWIKEETQATAWDKLKVSGFLRIGSTNTEALDQARLGASNGTLIYAEEQTAGRGRKGRDWHSPAKKGLFFTLVLRPSQPRKYWPLLTHAASVALFETLKDFSERELAEHPYAIDLKWPNDVLLSGKKCAGILLETVSAGDAAVVGVGINVREGSVPKSLAHEATCLDEMAHELVPRRKILVSFLRRFQAHYLAFERGEHGELLDRWKTCSSMWNGARVWITDGDRRRSAVTCGLSEIGALLVRTPEGAIETVLAGDIRVRRA